MVGLASPLATAELGSGPDNGLPAPRPSIPIVEGGLKVEGRRVAGPLSFKERKEEGEVKWGIRARFEPPDVSPDIGNYSSSSFFLFRTKLVVVMSPPLSLSLSFLLWRSNLFESRGVKFRIPLPRKAKLGCD